MVKIANISVRDISKVGFAQTAVRFFSNIFQYFFLKFSGNAYKCISHLKLNGGRFLI